MGQKVQGEGVKKEGAHQPVREPAQQTEMSPEEIVAIRKKAGLSQKGLAKKLGVSLNSISNWERGSTSPRAASLKKLLAMRK
jgi:DNA-binding transcriptional regulator YiaG